MILINDWTFITLKNRHYNHHQARISLSQNIPSSLSFIRRFLDPQSYSTYTHGNSDSTKRIQKTSERKEEEEKKQRIQTKNERAREVVSKKSRSCVAGIQTPAKYHHVPVIIQFVSREGSRQRVFQARERARIRRDLRQISRAPVPRDETREFVHAALSLGIVTPPANNGLSATQPKLENSNGRSWPRLCEPRRCHRILRILFTAGVYTCTYDTHGA